MKIITVSGADISLYHVAANEYDDATQFYRIMELNGLADPMINGLMTLLIPDADRNSTDGIPNQ